jgi:hypothetical protein
MDNDSALLRRIDRLESQLARHEAADAVQKLMGAYTVNFSPKYMCRALDFYALDRPDVSVEIGDRGVFVGEPALRKLFTELFAMDHAGNLLIHYLATPMIEVAADGNSVRGVWRSPGIEAVVPPGGGQPVPLWSFGAYAVDFIRVGPTWKILHLHWFRTIKCSYREAWVDDLSMTRTGALPGSDFAHPTTFHNPYTPESVQEPVPPCPPPFESMGSKDWMIQAKAIDS